MIVKEYIVYELDKKQFRTLNELRIYTALKIDEYKDKDLSKKENREALNKYLSVEIQQRDEFGQLETVNILDI